MPSITTGTLPDYVLSWEPAWSAALLNDSQALQWALTRADGLASVVPQSGVLGVLRPDGVTDFVATIECSASAPAAAMTVGGTYTFALLGAYYLTLTLSINDSTDTQSVAASKAIVVSNPQATYDANFLQTNVLFATRFHAADTTLSNPDFLDPELLYCLSMVGNLPELAAARALRGLAADAARLAVVTKKGTRGNDESGVYVALLAMADALERVAPALPVVNSPDAQFTLGSVAAGTVGTMDLW